MEASKILSSSLLDLIFESRNKSYGAYELRSSYNKRIAKALGIGLSLVLVLAIGSVFARKGSGPGRINDHITVITQEIPQDEEEKIIPPPEKTPPPVQVKTQQFTTFKIVPEDDIVPPPSTDDLQDAKIGLKTIEGITDDNFVTPEEIDQKKGLAETKKVDVPDEPFTAVEIEASYPGGKLKWQQFLERNLNPEAPTDKGAPIGSYTVIVRFVVDESGTVSNIVTLTSHGYGMEEEAIKVIKKASSVKWVPAFQNGRMVKAYRSQPITFVVE